VLDLSHSGHQSSILLWMLITPVITTKGVGHTVAVTHHHGIPHTSLLSFLHVLTHVRYCWRRAAVMYWSTSDLGSCYDSAGSGTRSLKSQPWMQPLFKLQVLMLAKSQWDARHSPKHLFALRLGVPWPKEALTRAVTQMGSPCVAGDLLRQRAPGLVAHGRSNRRLREAAGGLRWEVVQEHTFGVTPDTLPLYCTTIMYYLESSRPHDDNAAAIGEHFRLCMPNLCCCMSR
jgi:hypothetical protein